MERIKIMGVHYGYRPSGNIPYVIPSLPRDPFFNAVSLLLHGDGTNGAQNNTFLDSSTNNFTVTRNGNTTQGTNTPFSQDAGYWSNCIVNNNTTSIATPDSSSFILSADFTVEMWLNNPSTAGYIPQVFNIGRGSNSDTPYASNGIMLQFTGDGVYLNGSNIGINLQSYCNSGQWMHIALCRTGSIFKIFINGTQIYSATFTAIINSGGKNVLIGSNPSVSSFGWYGYISNLRVVNGTGLYTSNFTPSATPLTAVTNTVLLTCQSNRFVDNSSNNFVITAPTGTPSVQPFSPFAPTSVYSTSVNGGSMYFDGTGDYLSNSGLTASGDFTWECWAYRTAAISTFQMLSSYDASTTWLGWITNGTSFYIGDNAAAVAYPITVPESINTWVHIAVVKVGSTMTLYWNGVSKGSGTSNGTFSFNKIGTYNGSYNFTGYMSNFRFVNGTAVYTANFTPPTAPLTAITNTSLLLSGTNAGIYDNAIKNDLETVGSAQVSTSVVKYGTGSILFNSATSDCLNTPATPNLNLYSGDFTVELWFYAISISPCTLIHQGTNWTLNYDATSGGRLYYQAGAVTTTPLITGAGSGVWNHVAIVKYGSTTKLYLNGTAASLSTTDVPANDTTTQLQIGKSSGAFNGYIDDLRVTKGIARYTANFTPPTAVFSNY